MASVSLYWPFDLGYPLLSMILCTAGYLAASQVIFLQMLQHLPRYNKQKAVGVAKCPRRAAQPLSGSCWKG